MRNRRRLLATLAVFAAASISLTGCLYSIIPEKAATSTASTSPDTSGVAKDLLRFYGQDVKWDACGTGFQCATVTAPLDWTDPTKADIDLALVRHRASNGTAIGSLLFNPGGPGESGVDFLKSSLTSAVGDPLAADYDVIGFDPRGVGSSTAITCFDAAGMDSYLFDIPANPRNTDAWTAEVQQSNKAFADACDANSGGILPYISTENAARDMDLLRAVLGDTTLNYLGYSYGTFLGATYAKLYPDRVGRMVLDGAIDPSQSGLESGIEQGIGFESALRAYMADCLTADDCPFRGTVDEAMADLGTLLATVDRTPLRNSDGRLLGGNALLTAIVTPLYSRDSWQYLTVALTDALQGNPDVAFQLVDLYYSRTDGTYDNNLIEAFTTYNCMDYPDDTTPEQQDAANAELAAKAPTIAPYWIGPNVCDEWPYPATGTPGPITADGAAPIVVVGTTNDPATPYQSAVALADQLSSGVLVTRVGEGHTGYNKGNACVDGAVESYLLKGTVPQDGLRCE